MKSIAVGGVEYITKEEAQEVYQDLLIARIKRKRSEFDMERSLMISKGKDDRVIREAMSHDRIFTDGLQEALRIISNPQY